MNKKQKRHFYDLVEESAFSVNDKERIYDIMRQVLEKKPEPLKMRRVRTKSVLVNLATWEEANGILRMHNVYDWLKGHAFCPVMIDELISEFRNDMVSNGKEYANFAAAFKKYVIKGYMSKKPEQLLAKDSPHTQRSNVKTITAGASI